MVALAAHGGHCCGARHLYGFSAVENQNPNEIVRQLATSDSGRLVEVILNGDQVRGYPAAVAKLAELGFVLVGHYINNNHNSHNYVFHRADRRLPLTGLAWWPGQVITPAMRGNLTPHRTLTQHIPARPTPPRPQPVLMRQHGRNFLLIGDRVRVNNERSARHGREFIIDSFRQEWGSNDTAVMRDPVDGGLFVLSVYSLIVVTRVAEPAPVPAPPPAAPPAVPQLPVQRHDQPDLHRIEGVARPAPAPVAPPPPPPTVVSSTFHNVLRTGRSEAGWMTLAQAREAAPRARSVDRRDVYSDGTVRWVEGVQE
jgi:hypothetical protein